VSDERHRRYFDDCCLAIGVTLGEVLEKRRDQAHIVCARKALAWAMREQFPGEASYPVIGRLMRRDHTTVMHSVSEFRQALSGQAEWATKLRVALTGERAPAVGLESPLDTLRSCPGIDLSGAVEMPLELEAVG
jgi:hypothetical protein